MKRLIVVYLALSCLIFTTLATAAVITIELSQVPTYLQCDQDCLCDQNWSESNIILSVTSSVAIATNTFATMAPPPGIPCDPNCNWWLGTNLFSNPQFVNPPLVQADTGIFLSPGQLNVDLTAINHFSLE